ncbi:MAG: 4Fe-4S dicluster domain-containing protein [Promethearchaeia archaeon]
MTHKVLVFEPKKCIGCRLCEQHCTMTHFGITNPAKARIRIIRDDALQMDFAIYCHQCSDPPCINACNFDALNRDEKTGAIQVNQENCVGCRKCIEQCPYAVPSMHPDKNYVLICDLCGGSPKCVEHCPENAIQYLKPGKAANIYKSIYTDELAAKMSQEVEK